MSLDEYEIKQIDGRNYRVRKNIEIHLSQSNTNEGENQIPLTYNDEPECTELLFDSTVIIESIQVNENYNKRRWKNHIFP